MICFVFKKRRKVGGKVCESKNYFGKLRMPWETGQPRVVALSTSDRREAERRLLEERDKAEKRHRGVLPPVEHEEAAEMPLAGLLDAFLVEMGAKGRSRWTVKKYAEMRTLFVRLGWKKLRCVSASEFSRHLARCRMSAKTCNDYRANVSRFMRWLQWQGKLGDNPLARVESVVREQRQYRRALSEEEAARLLAVAPRKRAVVYLLLLETALRRGELEELRACDVVLDTPSPFIRIPAGVDKNNQEWTNPIRSHVAEAVRELLPDDPLPFEKVFRGKVPRARELRKDLAAAGIPFLDELGRRFDMHAFRVTVATNLVLADENPRVVMQFMRHRNLATTMKVYTDSRRIPLAAAGAKLPKITMRNRGESVSVESTQKSTQTVRLTVQSSAQLDTPGQARENLAMRHALGI